MTDEQFVYNQDIKERKSMRTGAFHKKNGSKSKKCSMPSDYLTRKEKKKLNSECVSVSMDKPMTNFNQFRSLSISTQQQYLQNLVNKYGARKSDFPVMFGVSYTTFMKHVDGQNLNVDFGKGRKKSMDKRFSRFLQQKTDISNKSILSSETEEGISEEVAKRCFGADIFEKKEENDQEVKEETVYHYGHHSYPSARSLTAEEVEKMEKEHFESLVRRAKDDGYIGAAYLKALYDQLLVLRFSEDFAKAIVLERAKNCGIY